MLELYTLFPRDERSKKSFSRSRKDNSLYVKAGDDGTSVGQLFGEGFISACSGSSISDISAGFYFLPRGT